MSRSRFALLGLLTLAGAVPLQISGDGAGGRSLRGTEDLRFATTAASPTGTALDMGVGEPGLLGEIQAALKDADGEEGQAATRALRRRGAQAAAMGPVELLLPEQLVSGRKDWLELTVRNAVCASLRADLAREGLKPSMADAEVTAVVESSSQRNATWVSVTVAIGGAKHQEQALQRLVDRVIGSPVVARKVLRHSALEGGVRDVKGGTAAVVALPGVEVEEEEEEEEGQGPEARGEAGQLAAVGPAAEPASRAGDQGEQTQDPGVLPEAPLPEPASPSHEREEAVREMQEKAQGLEKSVEQWDDASRAETGSSGDDVMTDEIAHAVEADQEAYAALTHKMESVDAAKPGRPPSDGDIASGVEEADRVAEKMREQGVGGGASSGDAGTGASATAVESALAATVDAMVAEVGEGPAPTLPSARAIDAVSKVHMHPFVSFSPPKQRRPCVSFTDPVSERCKRASTLRECFGASYAANRTALVNCTGLTSDDDILLIWKRDARPILCQDCYDGSENTTLVEGMRNYTQLREGNEELNEAFGVYESVFNQIHAVHVNLTWKKAEKRAVDKAITLLRADAERAESAEAGAEATLASNDLTEEESKVATNVVALNQTLADDERELHLVRDRIVQQGKMETVEKEEQERDTARSRHIEGLVRVAEEAAAHDRTGSTDSPQIDALLKKLSAIAPDYGPPQALLEVSGQSMESGDTDPTLRELLDYARDHHLSDPSAVAQSLVVLLSDNRTDAMAHARRAKVASDQVHAFKSKKTHIEASLAEIRRRITRLVAIMRDLEEYNGANDRMLKRLQRLVEAGRMSQREIERLTGVYTRRGARLEDEIEDLDNALADLLKQNQTAWEDVLRKNQTLHELCYGILREGHDACHLINKTTELHPVSIPRTAAFPKPQCDGEDCASAPASTAPLGPKCKMCITIGAALGEPDASRACVDLLYCQPSTRTTAFQSRCRPHGVFINGTCHCAPGWSGPNCTHKLCTPRDCSGHGMCDSDTGVCMCDDSWRGDACDRSVCDSAGDKRTCEGANGFCDPLGVCRCPSGRVGTMCNLTTTHCPSNCHANKGWGVCAMSGCECVPDRDGADCSEAVTDCGPHGNYSKTWNRCECSPGWTGKRCGDRVPSCSSCSPQHGQCARHGDAVECECAIGYVGKDCKTSVLDALGNDRFERCLSQRCIAGDSMSSSLASITAARACLEVCFVDPALSDEAFVARFHERVDRHMASARYARHHLGDLMLRRLGKDPATLGTPVRYTFNRTLNSPVTAATVLVSTLNAAVNTHRTDVWGEFKDEREELMALMTALVKALARRNRQARFAEAAPFEKQPDLNGCIARHYPANKDLGNYICKWLKKEIRSRKERSNSRGCKSTARRRYSYSAEAALQVVDDAGKTPVLEADSDEFLDAVHSQVSGSKKDRIESCLLESSTQLMEKPHKADLALK